MSTSNAAGRFEEDPLLENSRTMESSRVKRVSYSARSHVQVIFQMYGSVLPQVLPFCLTNVAWTLLINFMKIYGVLDITFQSIVGHQFMGFLVSFLVVSRCNISYHRFMEMRRYLSEAYRSCRELNQFACIYTLDATTPMAQAWRREIAFRTIIMLRVTMEALHRSSMTMAMQEEEQLPEEVNVLPAGQHYQRVRSFAHNAEQSMLEKNFRAPVMLSFNLREIIMSHQVPLGYKLQVNEYRDLLGFVTSYMSAYHGFKVLVFTPYPFPLAQMTRIFIFFWVYSLPLVLVESLKSIYDCIVLIFFITFGFLGIEYVSMSLDDPFGSDDPNDFDDEGMAQVVYEDIYLVLYKTDGAASVEELRKRVLIRYLQGSALQNYQDDIMQDGFWERKALF